MIGARMTFDEWLRTADLRRDLVRAVGFVRWWELNLDECDAAVRDAEKRGVDVVAREMLSR